MPQLDPTWVPSQVFWLVITFVMMVFLMSKVVVPKIKAVVDDRNKRIDDDLSQAEELKARADEVYEKYSSSVEGAKKQADEIVEKAKSEMLSYSEDKSKELEVKLANMIEDGEKQIADIKKDAMLQIQDIVCDTASLSCEKLTGQKVDDKKIKEVVKKVVEAKS